MSAALSPEFLAEAPEMTMESQKVYEGRGTSSDRQMPRTV